VIRKAFFIGLPGSRRRFARVIHFAGTMTVLKKFGRSL
jgi:hypothetical protein